MRIDLIAVPYDSGQPGRRCGLGPLALIEAGLPVRLEALGHATAQHFITVPDLFPCEAGTGMRLAARLAERVRTSIAAGAFPVVLAGNCLTAVGTIAGAQADGVLWCDAHADLNTPETSLSGFVDGMALAVATGRAWRALAETVPGFAPLSDDKIILFGARDLDPAERSLIEETPIVLAEPSTIGADLRDLAGRAARSYLHLDMDVHDPAEIRASGYAVPGGADSAAVRALLADAARTIAPVALAVTAYDPAFDPEAKAAESAIAALEAFFKARL